MRTFSDAACSGVGVPCPGKATCPSCAKSGCSHPRPDVLNRVACPALYAAGHSKSGNPLHRAEVAFEVGLGLLVQGRRIKKQGAWTERLCLSGLREGGGPGAGMRKEAGWIYIFYCSLHKLKCTCAFWSRRPPQIHPSTIQTQGGDPSTPSLSSSPTAKDQMGHALPSCSVSPAPHPLLMVAPTALIRRDWHSRPRSPVFSAVKNLPMGGPEAPRTSNPD